MAIGTWLGAADTVTRIERLAATTGKDREATPLRSAAFPHIAVGKGWSTTFYITNLDSGRTANFQLRLVSAGGRELILPVQLSSGVSGTGSSIYGNLRPAETIVIDVTGPADSDPVYGWADLSSTSFFYGFSGYAIHRNRLPDQAEQSFTVALETKTHSGMMLLLDNRDGYSTGAVIANTSSYYTSEIIVRVINPDGTSGPKQLLTIGPMAIALIPMHEMFPDVKDRLVAIEFEGQDSRAKITGFGLRLGPDGQLRHFPSFTTD
ncbi:MAG: hypothetical protein SGI92_25470 [Bryobacteraceae bacterium]|nr:hypothetical protein [Bryobacteraceae bacterium]